MTDDARSSRAGGNPSACEAADPEANQETPIANCEEAVRFLEWFRPDGPWCVAAKSPDEGARLDGRRYDKNALPQLNRWLGQQCENHNLYFHVNSVRSDFRGGKAAKHDIERVEFLHVDIDPKGGEVLTDEQTRIRRLLTDKLPQDVPPPSAVVFSGGGYQAFWRLAEPISITGNADEVARVEGYNRALEQIFGGDNCHNIDRIMRLPGTVNLPDAKKKEKGRVPALAKVVEFNDVAHPLSAFPKPSEQASKNGSFGRRGEHVQLDELEKWGVPPRIKIILVNGHHPDEPKQGDNSRSAWLFDAVCSLIRRKVPDEIIFSIITDSEYGISKSVLGHQGRSHEKYARRQIERAHRSNAEEDNQDLRSVNAQHAVIRDYGGRTRVMTERQRHEMQFQSVDDFCNGYLSRSVTIGVDAKGNAVVKPLARWWLSHPHCRVYERAEFLPGLEAEDGVFNLWRGWPVEARKGDCSLFLAFVRDVICAGSRACEEFLLDWMAHAVQRPDELAVVAIALRGGQGIGKSFFVEHFGELFGKHFVPVTDPKHVVGNFNSMLMEALLVFADEAFAANDKRAEGVLKGLVTQAHITIEPKGVNAFKARKFLRLILASNHDWVIPADADDRRFLVLDVSDARKRDNTYFAAIEHEWRNGGRQALMHSLRQRDIASFDHRRRPETVALTDQKVHSLRGARRLVYQMLYKGDAPQLKIDGERVFVATRELIEHYGERVNETAVGRELGHVACERKSARETCDGVQRRGYWLPALAIARADWSRTVGIEARWPDDDGQWECVQSEPIL
ncbi:MAG: DUF5906 domain-containing protein [Micropepsaceae bacterium]